jgi:malate synthase
MGTHPDLVGVSHGVFDKYMPTKNQIHKERDFHVTGVLLEVPVGITEEELEKNINVSILFCRLAGSTAGAAAIHHLMEDAATTEISNQNM